MNSNTAIAAEELAMLVGTPTAPAIFDVRRRIAFDAAERLIAGARWCDHRSVKPNSADEAVVVYCVHGHQVSQSAAALLRSHGVNARYLAGGIDAFIDAGGTTIEKAALPECWAERPTRWVTRERPKIDRIACPWLIRRFIDGQAEFHYVSADWVGPVAEELDAVPFDVPDIPFSHQGEYCSFDAFLQRFEIADAALQHLAAIVRAADTDRLDLAPQAAGLLAASLGLSALHRDDGAALDAGMVLYDAFYAWARHATDETRNWNPDAMRAA